jgi:hypothetical protein
MDAATVYLELEPRVWSVGDTSAKLCAVRVHWKDGRKWRRVRIVSENLESPGALLGRIGNLIAGAETSEEIAQAIFDHA